MAEYASKGIAGTGLGLGIAGTALGLLNNNNGNGILGGLFGNNCPKYTDDLQAKIAELTAEKYANTVSIETYKAAVERDAKTSARFEELAREIADMRVREAQTQGQINTVALTAQNGITANAGAIACLQATVAGITKCVVPASAVCPAPMPLHNSWTAPAAGASTT